MNPRKVYAIICIGLIILATFLRLILPSSFLMSIFLVLLFVHALISLYVAYSFYEMYVLHEKQGSKLTLSKDKLNIHWD